MVAVKYKYPNENEVIIDGASSYESKQLPVQKLTFYQPVGIATRNNTGVQYFWGTIGTYFFADKSNSNPFLKKYSSEYYAEEYGKDPILGQIFNRSEIYYLPENGQKTLAAVNFIEKSPIYRFKSVNASLYAQAIAEPDKNTTNFYTHWDYHFPHLRRLGLLWNKNNLHAKVSEGIESLALARTVDSYTTHLRGANSTDSSGNSYQPILYSFSSPVHWHEVYTYQASYRLRIFQGNVQVFERTELYQPQYVEIIGKLSCPTNTCPVKCGDQVCCYGSDGVSVTNFPYSESIYQ